MVRFPRQRIAVKARRTVHSLCPCRWAFDESAAREGGDPQVIHRPPRPDGRKWPALRPLGRVHLRGPRQGLRVDILPDLRHLAISNFDVEDPIVLERLIRGFDFPRSDADDQNPVSLRHEFEGLRCGLPPSVSV